MDSYSSWHIHHGFLYDMAGNVWEWCHDIVNVNEGSVDLGADLVTNPWGLPTGLYRVLRNGTGYWHPNAIRAADRYSRGATERFDSNGFRCARTLP